MKRIVGILVITATLGVTAGELLAQEAPYLRTPHRFTLSLDGGIAVPAAPEIYKEAWNTTLPIEIGFGYSVFPWLEIGVVLSSANFGSNSLEAKRQIDFLGTQTVDGGDISTKKFLVNTRFIAVPNQRVNPFLEFGIGAFTTTATDLEVDGVFTNTMNDASGMAINIGMGLQYALNEGWSTYTKFDWSINIDSSFAPSDLLINPTVETPSVEGDGSQQYANILVGLMVRL